MHQNVHARYICMYGLPRCHLALLSTYVVSQVSFLSYEIELSYQFMPALPIVCKPQSVSIFRIQNSMLFILHACYTV
jgi:hypothetical protein